MNIARLLLPSHLDVILKDFCIMRNPPEQSGSRQKNIDAGIEWICRAQDANKDGGVPSSYSFVHGWGASYPEVTGYIVPTFFNYYHASREQDIRIRALKMADWLVSIQFENGAFQGGDMSVAAKPSVFNTGQILEGLVRAYTETENIVYYESAKRAAEWLCDVQEEEGFWRIHNFKKMARVYDTRVAMPLLQLYRASSVKTEAYLIAARKNLEWALTNQNKGGWFYNCDNSVEHNHAPLTHTLSYTAEGFLECGLLLKEERYIKAAEKTALAMLKIFERDKILYARYDEHWKPQADYVCLTGCAQASFIWQRLFEFSQDYRYLNAALKMNDFLSSTQDLGSRNRGIYGGIKGSLPLWGAYERFQYINWAVKFFLDALLLEQKLTKELIPNERRVDLQR